MTSTLVHRTSGKSFTQYNNRLAHTNGVRVWSTNLSQSIQTQGKQAGHTIFDPSKSSTWKEASGSTWQISYGDQSSASGTVGTDVVTVGGLAIQNQAVEVANQISDQFVQSTGDGLLGLAWGSINTVQPNPVETPVENMISQDDMCVLNFQGRSFSADA